MTDVPNTYCQRLGISVPRVEVVAQIPEVRLFHLVVVALIERGGPMTVDEIAERLDRAALPARFTTPDLAASVKKAWHGEPPLVRDGDDRLALDLLSSDLRHLQFVTGLRTRPATRQASEEFRLPGDEVPLSQEEVTAAFKDRVVYTCSSVRRAAAILDAWGSPQPLDEIERRLRGLTDHCGKIDETTVRAWRTDLMSVEPGGVLRLNPASPVVGAFRRAIRRMAFPRLRVAADSQRFKGEWRERSRARAVEERAAMDLARQTRRALLHIVRAGKPAAAAVVIDVQRRDARVFLGDDLALLAARLEDFDFLAGVDLRASLRAVGLDPDRWLLAELRPVPRTFRPAARSTVAVTLDAVVRATTGIRRVPAGAGAWERLLDEKRGRDVADRLTAEARALCVLYEYGALHGGVRARTRPGDRLLPVDWSLGGDPDIHSVLDAAMRAYAAVDLVIGAPPDPADPWKRAVRASIADCVWPQLVVRTPAGVQLVDGDQVCAVRVADPTAAATVRPRHRFLQREGVCQLKVTLDGIEPPIWRRLVVPASYTLERLHDVLQKALGWTNSHLHVFQYGDERVGIPYELGDLDDTYTRSGRIVHLGDIVAQGHRRFVYEYDFGDGWTHTIDVEDVRDGDEEPSPLCLDGARACPPEDCGGVDGYQRLLDIVFDPTHEEFEEMRTWAGSAFQPERFELRRVNEQLSRW
jgi:hypothetical protein